MDVKELKPSCDIKYTKLIQRFVKDYNLPINIFDEELFSYYMTTYKNFPTETWFKLVEKIKNEYGGNVEAWLDYCANVRDTAINTLLEHPVYKTFNQTSLEQYAIKAPCGRSSCFTEACDGSKFISIDLRKANFQALKAVGVIKDNTYEDFIKSMGGDDYIADSKYLRQVIFGKLNPSRQITVERYLTYQVWKNLPKIGFEWWNDSYDLFSFDNDEIIYRLKDGKTPTQAPFEGDMGDLCKLVQSMVKTLLGIDVRVEYFEIKDLKIYNVTDDKVDAYERHNLVTDERKLKKASTTFYPQIYKLWKGQKITPKDKLFFFENQICTFKNSLKRKKK